MGVIVLCADTESLQRPALMGLDDIALENFSWLLTFSNAYEARRFIRESSKVDEVWVVSSDDISAINLAAAIKHDNRQQSVYLVSFEMTGSLVSCMRAAGITGMLTRQGFTARFALEQQRRSAIGQTDDFSAAKHVAQNAQEPLDSSGPSFVENASKKTPATSSKTDVQENLDCASTQRLSAVTQVIDTEEVKPDRAQKRRSHNTAFVFSVVSGSGGVGKSTVAALSAFCAQKCGYRTLLLDCDLQFGDLHHFMGVEHPVRIEDILNDPLVAERLNPSEDSPALVACAGCLEEADSLARMLPDVIEMLSPQFDVIVINTGASWAEHHAVLLESSSCSLFLVDQRASSVRATRRALDVCARCGIATGSFVYAVNHCGRGALLTSVDVSCALQGVHVFELKDGGSMVEELLGAGMARELAGERNDLCTSIEHMLYELLPLSGNIDFAAVNSSKKTGRRHSGNSVRKTRRERRERDSVQHDRTHDDIQNSSEAIHWKNDHRSETSVMSS